MSRGSFQRLLSFNPVPRGKSFTGLSVKAPSLCLQGHCGGLKENGPKGSGTIRRRGLVGESVSPWGWAFEVSLLRIGPSESVDFLLHVRCRTSCSSVNIMDSETVSEPPKLKVFFIRVVMTMASLHSNKNPN